MIRLPAASCVPCSLWVKWFGIGFYAPALLREYPLWPTCQCLIELDHFCPLLPLCCVHQDLSLMNLSHCYAAFIVSFIVVAVEGIGDITVRLC